MTRTIALLGPVIATRQRAAELRKSIESAIAEGEFVRIDLSAIEVCSATAMDELVHPLPLDKYAIVRANRDVGETYATVLARRQR